MIMEEVFILEMIITWDKPYRGNTRQRDNAYKVRTGLGRIERIP